MTSYTIARGRAAARDGVLRLEALVGGAPVYFEYSGAVPFRELSGDPFVAPAMVHAMAQRQCIALDDALPVSCVLRAGLEEYQELYLHWYQPLHRVAIAPNPARIGGPASNTVALFFSGGVDAHYSLLRHRDDITHLVLCLGLDIPQQEQARWERVRAVAARVAADQGMQLVTVDTNVKAALEHPTFDNHGTVLTSTVLGLDFDRLIVPATLDYAWLQLYGSHPLIDSVLHTVQTRVQHDGLVARSLKIRRLVEAGVDLSDLRVCNRFTDYNCGSCEKCLRTMVALELLDARVDAFPPLRNGEPIDRLPVLQQYWNVYWEDLLRLAQEVGHAEFIRAISALLRRYHRWRAVHDLDAAWLGSGLKTLRRTLRRTLRGLRRV